MKPHRTLGPRQRKRNQLAGFGEGLFNILVACIWPHQALFSDSSIVGFLFGFSLAASFAAYQLLDEYKQASAALQSSVEELRISTEKVSSTINSVIFII
jgi:hypothetical protein